MIQSNLRTWFLEYLFFVYLGILAPVLELEDLSHSHVSNGKLIRRTIENAFRMIRVISELGFLSSAKFMN